MREFYTVNQLAEDLGITPRTIRFYETKGLIAPQRAGTMRIFNRRDRARLMIVLRGKRLGFTLAEIREYLELYDADRTKREQMRMLLAKTQERITGLEQQHRDLTQTLAELRAIEAEARSALDALAETAGNQQHQAEG